MEENGADIQFGFITGTTPPRERGACALRESGNSRKYHAHKSPQIVRHDGTVAVRITIRSDHRLARHSRTNSQSKHRELVWSLYVGASFQDVDKLDRRTANERNDACDVGNVTSSLGAALEIG